RLSYFHFAIISIAMFLLSCTITDTTTNNFSYVINNTSDKELKIVVKTNRVDTTLNITAHTDGTIYNGYEEFVGDAPSFGNPFFLKVFSVLKIEAADKSTITLDYLNQSNWKSSTSGISMGSTKTTTTIYKINIANSNFQ
ncbi:MAG TPA: hypothetical protein VI413_04270, partial [Paludibacter sp.]